VIDYKEGIGYNFIEVNGTPGFKILEGNFEDVCYTYSNVSVSESPENDEDLPAVLTFNFDVVDNAGYTDEEFKTVDFKNKIGDILLSVLQNNMENAIEPEQTYFEEPSL
jgi:hypothetical protein